MSVIYPHRKEQTNHMAKLPILLSCRVRLSNEQRDTLKKAYREYREQHMQPSPESIGGSTVKTVTAQAAPPLVNNWSDLVVNDVICTRDTIPMTTIIQIQDALGVEVLSPDDVLEAAKGYIEYCFNHGKEKE